MKNGFIHKSAGIIIKDRKVLVGRSEGKEHFISPGGLIEDGETPKQALVRELYEELTIHTKEEDFEEFETFVSETTIFEGIEMKMDTHIVKTWEGELQPSSEVEELLWLDSNIPEGIKIGSIFENALMLRLKEVNLID
jgi:8-oxo-dGTP pyrophosphatase MutT (NUDIX family)